MIQYGKANQQIALNLSELNLYKLDFMREYNWKILREIDITDTQIDNIDLLDKYPLLKIIKAGSNRIAEVNLMALAKLEEIDLTDNELTEIPCLSASDRLIVYRLNGNQIKVMISHRFLIPTSRLDGNGPPRGKKNKHVL